MLISSQGVKIKVTVTNEGLRSPCNFALVIQKALLDNILKSVKDCSMNMIIDVLQHLRTSQLHA